MTSRRKRSAAIVAKIKEIAEKMNISVSTVYKALSDAEDVNPETKKKILKTAINMGYVAKRKGDNHKRICVFIDQPDDNHVQYFDYEVMMAFKRNAIHSGHEVSIMSLDYTLNQSKSFDELMDEYQFDGAVILGLSNFNPYFEQLKTTSHPVVILDNFLENQMVASVCCDNMKGMKLAIDHLVDLGHTRIGFINGQNDAYVCKERLGGYISSIALRGIVFDPALVCNGNFTEESAAPLVHNLVSRGVTAIMCCNDMLAIGAIKELKRMGLNVPRDISVVGFDDIKLSSYITPKLTTIHTDLSKMGEKLFIVLELLMKDNRLDMSLQPSYLVVRESTATANSIAE